MSQTDNQTRAAQRTSRWKSTSIRTRLIAGIALLLVISAAIIGVAVSSIGNLLGGQRDLSADAVPYMNGINQAAIAAKAAANDERGFLLTGDRKYVDEAVGRRTAELAGLAQARAAAGNSARAAAVDAISAKLSAFNGALDAEFRQYGTDKAAALAASTGKNRDLRKSYEDGIDSAIVSAEQFVKHLTSTQEEVAHSSRTTLFVLLGVLTAFGGTLAWLLTRAVNRPVQRLLGVLAAAGRRDITVRAELTGPRELAQMAEATNAMLEATHTAVSTIAARARTLSETAGQMAQSSHQIAGTSGQAARQADEVSVTAEQVSASVQAIATAAEEMGATIGEIANSVSNATTVAAQAAAVSESAKAAVAQLDVSSAEIDVVVKTITSIAEQTNLLALNATIEAARAGESGRGFAVVAGEVKELAQETARATGDIAARIRAIQEDTQQAIDAISSIAGVITEINQHQTTIASSVEEQSATTQEMSRSISDAATGSTGIAGSIVSVAQSVAATTNEIDEAQRGAASLAAMGAELTELVSQFTH